MKNQEAKNRYKEHDYNEDGKFGWNDHLYRFLTNKSKLPEAKKKKKKNKNQKLRNHVYLVIDRGMEASKAIEKKNTLKARFDSANDNTFCK